MRNVEPWESACFAYQTVWKLSVSVLQYNIIMIRSSTILFDYHFFRIVFKSWKQIVWKHSFVALFHKSFIFEEKGPITSFYDKVHNSLAEEVFGRALPTYCKRYELISDSSVVYVLRQRYLHASEKRFSGFRNNYLAHYTLLS